MALQPKHPIFQKLDFQPVAAPQSDVLLSPLTFGTDYEQAFTHRVERVASRYLEGHGIFIQTAALRGPFGKDWVNPWNQDRGAILETRKRKRNPVPRADLEQSKLRRVEERRVRDERAYALQGDGLGKSRARPVDLTEDGGVHPPLRKKHKDNFRTSPSRGTTKGEDSSGLRLGEVQDMGILVTDVVSPPGMSKGDVTTTLEQIRTRHSKSPNQCRLQAMDSEFDSIERTEKERARAPCVHAIQQSVGTCELDKSTCTKAMHPDSPSLIAEAKFTSRDDQDRPPNPDVHDRSKSRTSQHNLPTPSDSGNECGNSMVAILFPRIYTSVDEVSTTAPAVMHLCGFTAINRSGASSGSKQELATNCVDDESIGDPHVISPDQANIMHQTETTALLTDMTRSTRLKEGQKCFQCGTQDTSTWRRGPEGPSTLCQKCGQMKYNRLKQMITAPSQLQRPITVIEDLPTPDLALSHSLSQPAPSLLCDDDLVGLIKTPASSFPRASSRKAALPHTKIFREMFPSGALRDAKDRDYSLFNLMGPRFKPEWGAIIRSSKLKPTTKSKPTSATPVAAATKPKQPRLITFDTPVVTRMLRSTRRAMEIRATVAAGAKLNVPATQETALDKKLTVDGSTAQQLDPESPITTRDENDVPSAIPENLAVVSKSFDSTTHKTNTETSGHIIEEYNVASGNTEHGETTAAMASISKLLESRTNMLLLAEEESPLRRLAERTASSFETVPTSHTMEMSLHEEEHVIQGTALEDVAGLEGAEETERLSASSPGSPYVSTQTAMLEAQVLFQEALSSPTKGSSFANSDDDQTETATRLHATLGPNLSAPVAELNTQAMFDAFVFDSPQASQMSTDGSPVPKHASFAQTPLGPKAANNEARRTSWGKGCLKRAARQSLPMMSMSSLREMTTLSSLGLSQENTQADDKMESYIDQAGAFLGDWLVDTSIGEG